MKLRTQDEALREKEQQWIQQALLGDSEAFVQLIELYQRSVFNLCYRMLGSLEDAEDGAQETFLRAFASLRRYDSARPFATWLLSIAAHYCIDQIRKRRIVAFSLQDLPDLEFAAHDPSPETTIGVKEDQQKVQQLLKTLSEIDRAVILFYYWFDFSYEEIAEALSLSVSAVKSRLHRARHTLANRWLRGYPEAFQESGQKGYESPVF